MSRTSQQPQGALLVILASLLALEGASAAIIAIDLGSEFLKVCLIKPGRTPIAVVGNEMSKRKSPALVSFVNGERLLGEEAFSFGVRYPETTYTRSRDLLGKQYDDPTIAAMLQQHLLPYEVVPHANRSTAAVRVTANLTVSAEELVASVLQYAKGIADDQAGVPVPDAVIVVPAFFGQAQRQALIEAASLAGLNIIGLINSHTAAALQYGIERDFTNKTQTILLCDMGAGSTEVALVKYSTYTVKEAGKAKEYNQLEVKDVDWAHDVGGNNLDALLADHFAKEFMAKYNIKEDIRNNAKSMAKMKRQVRRTKEVLSANTAAPFSVEELYEGRDFQSSITREQFEGLAGDFFKRAAAPLARIVARNNLTADNVDAVELLGGGSRVPKLQAALSEVLGGRGLDRHLDADEAKVLGAALFAANLSSTFRLRKFGMADLSMYGIQLHVDEIHELPPAPPALAEAGNPPAAGIVKGKGKEAAKTDSEPNTILRNLLPVGKKLPIKRVVHFNRLTADPLVVSLAYNTSTPHGLPPGVTSPALATFTITGIDDVVKRYNTSGIVNLRFEADYSGLLRLDKAEALVDYTVMVEEKEKLPPPPPLDDDLSALLANLTQGGKVFNASDMSDFAAKYDELKKKTEAKKAASESEAKDSAKGPAGQSNEEKEADGEATDDPAADKDAAADEAEEDSQAEMEQDSGVKVNTPGANDTNTSSVTGQDAKNATEPPLKPKVLVPKKKTAKVSLQLGGAAWLYPSLKGDGMTTSRGRLDGWVAAEAIKRENAKARNDLESYIIRMKEALETEELLQKVTSEAARISFHTALIEQEEWLYMEAADDVPAAELRKRLQALKDLGDPMVTRKQEFEARPEVLQKLHQALELGLKIANAWADTKPWISEQDVAEVVAKLEDWGKHLAAKEAAQSKKADDEEPAFRVQELESGWEAVDRAFTRVNNKRKPKPPPEPSPPPAPASTPDAAANSGDAASGSTGKDTGNSTADSGDGHAAGEKSGGTDASSSGSRTTAGADSSKGRDDKDSSSGNGKEPGAGPTTPAKGPAADKAKEADSKQKEKAAAKAKADKAKADKAKAEKTKSEKAKAEKAKAEKAKADRGRSGSGGQGAGTAKDSGAKGFKGSSRKTELR